MKPCFALLLAVLINSCDGMHNSQSDDVNPPQEQMWQQFNQGLTGGTVLCFAKQGSYVFVGTDGGGVYRTTNHGTTWEASNAGLDNPFVTSFVAIGPKIFAGTRAASISNGDGVYESFDSGRVWVAINKGLPNKDVFSLGRNSLGELLVGTANGLFKLNGDSSWHSSLPGATIYDIALTANGYVFCTSGPHIYRSSDFGNTWNQKSTGLTSYTILTLEKDANDALLLANSLGNIVRSTDYAETWQPVSGQPSVTRINAISNAGGTWYIASDSGVFKSANDGDSWELSNLDMITDKRNPYVRTVFSDGTILLGVDGQGVYRSLSGNNDWEQTIVGLEAAQVRDVVSDQAGTVYALTGNGVYRLLSQSQQWESISTGLPTFNLRKIEVAPNGDLYTIGAFTLFSLKLNSQIWQNVSLPISNFFCGTTGLDVNSNNGDILCSTCELFQSTDNGQSWNVLTPSLHPYSYLFTSDGLIITGIYRSTDNGTSWSQSVVSSGLNSVSVYEQILTQRGIIYAATSGGLFKSTDSAVTWTKPLQEFINIPDLLDLSDSSIVFAKQGEGLFLLNTTGSVSSMNSGLPLIQITSLAKTGNYLFLGTRGAGVFRIANN